MEVINFENHQEYRPDIIFTNKDQEIVLYVEIKAKKLEKILRQDAISQLNTYLKDIKQNIPFAALVDLEEISILAFTDERKIKNTISLKTNDILSNYDPEFSKKRIFDFHLETLVKSWLRDLSYHWNSDTPPGYNELAKIGLLSLIEDKENTYIIRK
jgi:Holliday junction resolvase